jgi:hypothetical protein
MRDIFIFMEVYVGNLVGDMGEVSRKPSFENLLEKYRSLSDSVKGPAIERLIRDETHYFLVDKCKLKWDNEARCFPDIEPDQYKYAQSVVRAAVGKTFSDRRP